LMHYRFDNDGDEHIFDANVSLRTMGCLKKIFIACTEHCSAYLVFKHLAFLKYIILQFILGGTLGNYIIYPPIHEQFKSSFLDLNSFLMHF
jgi:hypothetical protein